MDALALRRVGWLHDPDISLGLSLLQLLVMGMEVVEFVWKDVGVWNEVKLTSAKSLLHLDVVVTKSVFSGDLIALREVVDFLVLVKTFV